MMATPAFQTEAAPIPDVPGALTIRIRGRATHDETPELRESLLEEVARVEAEKIVIELSEIEAMDTAGAAVLVEALNLAHKRGRRMLLCSPSESVLRTFRLAGFAEVLDYCCATPEETRQRLVE